MKSVGEVMAIGRTFEESLQKAIRQVDPRWNGFEVYGFKDLTDEELDTALSTPTDMRLFAIAYAMYNRGYTVDQLHDLTKIDKVCFSPLLVLVLCLLSTVVPLQSRQHRPDSPPG